MTNHTKGEKCYVKYHAYSYFSREQQRKVLPHAIHTASIVYLYAYRSVGALWTAAVPHTTSLEATGMINSP